MMTRLHILRKDYSSLLSEVKEVIALRDNHTIARARILFAQGGDKLASVRERLSLHVTR